MTPREDKARPHCNLGSENSSSQLRPLHSNPSPQGHSPPQGDLDGSGETGCEQVSWEVRDHGQELVSLTGRQLDAVLHRWGQGHLGKWVIWVDCCNLRGEHRRCWLSWRMSCTGMRRKGDSTKASSCGFSPLSPSGKG